jgi:WD40 repeat protein
VARVFLSHASEDRRVAGKVHGWLSAGGHEVFLDQDLRDGITVGEQWQDRLYERLRWADAVLCVITAAYVRSVWCAAEVGIAQSRGARLLPLLAEPGVEHPLLQPVQYADYAADPPAALAALQAALRRIEASGGWGWPDDRSPYPGLRSFDTDLHLVFFGRRAETNSLAGLLRSPAERTEGGLLVVVGPSGCGKSSLVRAGLVPAMAAEPDWSTLPALVPGADPVRALARSLAAAARSLGSGWTLQRVRERLGAEGGLLEMAEELLLADTGRRLRRLLLVVDQCEELLTRTPAAERRRFAKLLRPALADPVMVVATLRPEFLTPLLESQELAGLPARVFAVRPLPRDALATVIAEPARVAGIDVEDELVARLVADTDTGQALPLLAFTLAQLAAGVGRGGHLSAARYDQLGGVQGALVRQADAALAEAQAATGRGRNEVIAGLLRLVTVDEHGRPTRWRAPRAQLPAQVATELGPFIGRRLLTTDTEQGAALVTVAHEAFLTAWPPLAEAISAAGAALRARRAVEQAAAEWDDHGRPPGRLWERGQLAAALTDTAARMQPTTGPARPHLQARQPRRRWPARAKVLVSEKVDFTPTAQAFLSASIRRDRHRRARTVTVLSVLLILTTAAAVVAGLGQRAARNEQQISTARQLTAQAGAVLDDDPRTALMLGIAAQRFHDDAATRAGLVASLTTTRYAGGFSPHRLPVNEVAFSPDGNTLATASDDRTAALWDLTVPSRPRRLGRPLTGHTDKVASLAFSPDGRLLATGSTDRTAIVWDVADRSRPRPLGRPLTGHRDVVWSVAFSPDGNILATGSADHTVRLWAMDDPAHPVRLGAALKGHRGRVFSAVFSPDRHRPTLATSSEDGAVILWDVAAPAHPTKLGPLAAADGSSLTSPVFSPDGRILATVSNGRSLMLWNVADPSRPAQLGSAPTGHRGMVFALAFSHHGRLLATGSEDHTATLWDVMDPEHPSRVGSALTGHHSSVLTVAFSPDRRLLATGSVDGGVILWDATDRSRLGPPLAGDAEVNAVAFSPNGRMLATAGDDGRTTLRDVTDRTRPITLGQPLPGHTDSVASVAFSPDSQTLATGSDDKTVLLWDLAEPRRPHRLGRLTGYKDAVVSVAFSPDGLLLATGSDDKTATLWDLSNRSRPVRLGPPLTGHQEAVASVAFSPDGQTLATGGVDAKTILWNIINPSRPEPLGAPLPSPRNVTSVAFSPTRRLLAIGSEDHTTAVWDVSDPLRPVRLGPPLVGHQEAVTSVAFSPDGRTLATGSADRTVLLWDLTDWARPVRLGPPLGAHVDAVTSVAFSPDGRTLASGSLDPDTILWSLDELIAARDHPVERACSLTGRGLDRDEWSGYISGQPYMETCPNEP